MSFCIGPFLTFNRREILSPRSAIAAGECSLLTALRKTKEVKVPGVLGVNFGTQNACL